METVKDVVAKISSLEVKGARNAAIVALEALQVFAQQTVVESKVEFLTELTRVQQLFFGARETEPLMRNALHCIINQARKSGLQNVSALRSLIVANTDQFLSELDASREQAAEIGAKLVQNEMTIFTHCNSSTATQMLIKARQAGKNFKVICTETRPTFQGRITAQKMVENNIETIFIVDSAARVFIPKADFIIVGADAITPEGNVVNKIGTSGLAVIALEACKPLYVVSELLKFDFITHYSEFEGIEQRDPFEVWKDAPEALNVQNPAFDVTHNRYIQGLICEKGVVLPQNVLKIVQQSYPWIFT